MDSLLTSNSQSVLVEGPPGIGKSTLCWELCRQWDTLKSLQRFKLVLQLKLREKRIQKSSSLNEIFYHRDAQLCQCVVSEVFECEGEGVLLIFDGFDELPSSVVKDKSSLLMELISGTCLPNATRLVTSRPSAFCSSKSFLLEYPFVEILGFTDECKLQFAEEAFKSDPDVVDYFKKFIVSNPVISSLMYIPMNCAIITQIFKDIRRRSKIVPKTMTQLYTLLVLVLIRRHMIERDEWDEHLGLPGRLEDLPENVASQLMQVGKLAYSGLLKDDVQLVFAGSDVEKDFQHLGLLSKTKEMYVCEGACSSYSFLHLSVQEFLAAWYASCNPRLVNVVSQKMASYDDIATSVEPLSTFGQFLAGMIGCEKMRFYRGPCLYRGGHLSRFKLNCLYESQSLTAKDSLKFILKSTAVSLTTPIDMYEFAYILIHAPVQWDLTFSTSFDPLVSGLVDHATYDKKVHGSVKELSLYHYTKQNYSSSRLENLPDSLFAVTTGLKVGVTSDCVPLIIKDLSMLPNLQSLYLDFRETLSNDYLLYQALGSIIKNLKKLELTMYNITVQGAVKLSDAISNGKFLQNLSVKMDCYQLRSQLALFNFQKVVESASLACPMLTHLDIWMPWPLPHFNRRLSSTIECVSFGVNLVPDCCILTNFCDWLLCIADICKRTSLKHVSIESYLPSMISYDIPPEIYCKFLSIVSHSLHCNPSLKIYWSCQFDPIYHIPIRTLSRALRKDRDITLHTLQRSKSLCDLTTIPFTTRFCGNYREDRSKFIKRTQSCPDLLEMQSVHNLDPRLHAFMCCRNKSNDYYYTNTPSKHRNSKQQLNPVKHPEATSTQSNSVCQII